LHYPVTLFNKVSFDCDPVNPGVAEDPEWQQTKTSVTMPAVSASDDTTISVWESEPMSFVSRVVAY
jgi:hypothetical protein